MEHITGLGLDRVLREVLSTKPFLGICLGLQSLMEWSEEGGRHAAYTEYGVRFTSAIARGHVFAVQFHPEKSQQPGLTLLSNFLRWDGSA